MYPRGAPGSHQIGNYVGLRGVWRSLALSFDFFRQAIGFCKDAGVSARVSEFFFFWGGGGFLIWIRV